MDDPLGSLDLSSASAVAALFDRAAEANLGAACRRGSVDQVAPRAVVLATGDLHDNPFHFARVVELARLEEGTEESPRRVTLHEIIHGGRLINGMDLSHRALARVAALKIAYPERVHTLLANHELSQIAGAGVVKDGVRLSEAFEAGIEFAFGEGAGEVSAAVGRFIRSMALALVSGRGTGSGVLFAHSLPPPELMERFDPTVLDRPLTEEDFAPRRGSAHLMVWGRDHTREQLRALADAWGVSLFVLGHEKAESGWRMVPPNAVVLNSDHERGAVLELDLGALPPWPPAPENGWRFVALDPGRRA